eukprot:RCo020061
MTRKEDYSVIQSNGSISLSPSCTVSLFGLTCTKSCWRGRPVVDQCKRGVTGLVRRNSCDSKSSENASFPALLFSCLVFVFHRVGASSSFPHYPLHPLPFHCPSLRCLRTLNLSPNSLLTLSRVAFLPAGQVENI